MSWRIISTYEAEGFKVERQEGHSRDAGRERIRVQTPAGQFLSVEELSLFDLAEILDDVCDMIEDGDF